MPSTAATAPPPSAPEQLAARLFSGEVGEWLLSTLREIKNQIIGNRTKKLVYLRLHAVPRIVALLSTSSLSPPVIVQAAAAVGSFACGVEEGVRAVLDAGAVQHLTVLLSHPDGKVVDSAARSLRIIFQSKMAPKYDFLLEENKEMQIKSKLILVLLDLIEEAGRVGDEAPFVLKSLIEESEELHRQALSVMAAERLCGSLSKGKAVLESRRLEGILLVLGELSSKLEQSRAQLIELQVPTLVIDLLKHDCPQVRTAACCVIKNISQSLKNLCAGRFGTESIVMPLVQLLGDSSSSVQTAALDAICNVAVNVTSKKSVLLQCGGVSILSQLCRSMHSKVRLKSVRALRNLMFLLDRKDKDFIFTEFPADTLASLISDSDPLVQEQALALAGNFVDGCGDSTKYICSEDMPILSAVSRQLKGASSPGMCIQAMFFLANIAAENNSHKDAVMDCLNLASSDLSISAPTKSFIVNFLQSKERLLRLSTLWCLVNLVFPNHKNSLRVSSLHSAGIISQLKTMVNDPCLDCKLRVRMVLEQCLESRE